MNTETKIFLKKKFKGYYSRHRIPAPPEVDRREFGVGTLSDKIKIRHKSFKTERDLGNFLRREAPYYISYSTAYYEFPQNQPMETKNWLGAELIFDLDIKMDLLNSSKLVRVRDETLNLVDFLVTDFGIPKKDIQVNFSGSKGYHIHVLNEEVKKLGGEERREIVDYVSGDIDFMDYLEPDRDVNTGEEIITGPKKGDAGWYGRIYAGLHNFIRDSPIEDLMEVKGIGKKKAESIYRNKKKILDELERGRYNYIPQIITIDLHSSQRPDPNVKEYDMIKNVSSPLVQKIIDEKAVKTLAAEDTDKMVTIDTSRLIRLPETIHGGSGLIAKKVKNLEEFDPLTEAVAFGEEKIRIDLKDKVSRFEIGGARFGPLHGTVEVPEFVGMYLLLKGLGDILQ
ncbi:MAG: DNA primase small subunit PriS [Candidatus Altiarchaeota archaeon]|nr:DNA primase small subunit PriS [Candidatus Altiarchaeota archaeon]